MEQSFSKIQDFKSFPFSKNFSAEVNYDGKKLFSIANTKICGKKFGSLVLA